MKENFTLIRPSLDVANDITTFCDVLGNQTANRSFFSKPNSRSEAATLSTSCLNDLNVYRLCSPKLFNKD
jgi:hypothetical protein